MNEDWQVEGALSGGWEEEPPPYLADPPGDLPTYGTLKYAPRTRQWVINAEPQVLELARRIFPGSEVRRGAVRLADHRRLVGDLNWLMLRYPLRIEDPERFAMALDRARTLAAAQQRLHQGLLPAEPDYARFSGELLDFQKTGLAFLLQGERVLLADEMGLGKTVQALAMLSREGRFPVLVVPPPHLVRNWEREVRRFLHHEDGAPLSVHVVTGLKPYPLPRADVYILHYLLLRGWKQALPDCHFPAVIFDEVQELRRAGSEKYSAASLLSDSAGKVVGLSGTPIYNRGGEIWNVMNAIDFHCLGSFDSFTRQWCTGFGRDVVAKPDRLNAFLVQEGMMLRRTKAEVLKELPPKRRLVQEIDADMPLFDALMEGAAGEARALPEDRFQRQRVIAELSARERRALGLAKAPFVCGFVRAMVEAGERVILCAHHHDVMDAYKQRLKALSPAFITGREDGAKKERAVARFMEGKTDLCVLSLRAASGLNLQRASCVVFGELDWSPAVHSQAEDRAHRIGQEDSVLCYYLVAAQGADLDIMEALGLKVSQFVGIMGDALPDEERLFRAGEEARAYMVGAVNRLRARQGLPPVRLEPPEEPGTPIFGN